MDKAEKTKLESYWKKFVSPHIDNNFIQRTLLLPYCSEKNLQKMGYNKEMIHKIKLGKQK